MLTQARTLTCKYHLAGMGRVAELRHLGRRSWQHVQTHTHLCVRAHLPMMACFDPLFAPFSWLTIMTTNARLPMSKHISVSLCVSAPVSLCVSVHVSLCVSAPVSLCVSAPGARSMHEQAAVPVGSQPASRFKGSNQRVLPLTRRRFYSTVHSDLKMCWANKPRSPRVFSHYFFER